jgi:serine/threonine protein kinase
MQQVPNDSDTTIQPPKRIASYSVLCELARGGMAQVFIAQRDGAKDVCVIKKLHAELQAQEPVVRRFYREANVASQLQHPNIARVIDAGFEGRDLYIALEYIAGQTLEAITRALQLRGQRLPIEAVIAMGAAVLDGLAYAHAMTDADGKSLGLVHRDLSPRNVMLSYAGETKIIDFGVARGNVDQNHTEPGMLLGTLRYFSPEQALGDIVDHRSDLYSLSVLLWELFAGRPLIAAATPIQMLSSIYEDEPPLLSSLDPTIPRAIEAVVAAGLAKERDERWQSAAELRHALLEAAPLPDKPQSILGPLMRELFPTDEMKLARRIADARGNLPYDPSKIGLPAGAMTLSDVDTRTRTEVLPQPMDASYEGLITDPTLAAENATKIVPPRIVAQRHFAVIAPLSDPTATRTPTFEPALSRWTLALAAVGFVLLTLFVALISSRFFQPETQELELEPEPAQTQAILPSVEPVRDEQLVQLEAKLSEARRAPQDLEHAADLRAMIQEAMVELDNTDRATVRELMRKSIADSSLDPLAHAVVVIKESRRRRAP